MTSLLAFTVNTCLPWTHDGKHVFTTAVVTAAHAGAPPHADPIVNAAVARFAQEGFAASVRAIADDAGVSAALVIKRFGSKAGLRTACDELVLTWIVSAKSENIRAAEAGRLLDVLTSKREYGPLVGYIMQSMLDGGRFGHEFLEHMIADADAYMADAVERGIVRPSRDERARTRYLVQSSIGSFLLTMLLAPNDQGPDGQSTDVATLSQRLQRETTLPMLELYSDGLFTDRRMLDEYLLYVTDPPTGEPNGASAPDPTDLV